MLRLGTRRVLSGLLDASQSHQRISFQEDTKLHGTKHGILQLATQHDESTTGTSNSDSRVGAEEAGEQAEAESNLTSVGCWEVSASCFFFWNWAFDFACRTQAVPTVSSADAEVHALGSWLRDLELRREPDKFNCCSCSYNVSFLKEPSPEGNVQDPNTAGIRRTNNNANGNQRTARLPIISVGLRGW